MRSAPTTCVIGGWMLASLCFSSAAAGQELLPNLRAFPASDLSVVKDINTGNPELRFSASSWNSGNGPLELVPGVGGTDGQIVYQRVYSQGGGFTDYEAGKFVFHPAHNHFHFEKYALYTLVPVNAPGQSNRMAYKTSFCVMDTTKVDTRLPGAPRKAVYSTCGTSVQGMSVGWSDTYGAHLAGQEIDITGLPEGLYQLIMQFDSANQLKETNENDNIACSVLRISATNLTVQEVGACGSQSSTLSVTSITPSNGWLGSIVQVVIKGTGFAPGVAVGFEGGSGPAPVADNITVLDTNTITATVSIKNGGKATDPVWDLRVGSAVLPNAFELLR